MKRKNLVSSFFALLSGVMILMSSCQKESDAMLENDPLNQKDLFRPNSASNGAGAYIVILNDDFQASGELSQTRGYHERNDVLKGYLNRFLHGHGIGNDVYDQVYTNVFIGFAAKLSSRQVQRLQADPMVQGVYPDHVYSLKKPPVVPVDPPAQTVPWGITRVGGGIDASGKTAWVVDTGIDLDHPDLNVDVARSMSFVTTERKPTADDLNGHGTHVSGTIAALDNSIGVVGVAPGAKLVSCRVLDRRGSGSFSWTVAALDYIYGAGTPGDVVNMSLGPSSPYIDPAVDAAVLKVAEKGILLSIAAGNESDDASLYSPAHNNHPNVFTISAMDSGDNWAYFSNYGEPVDFCAPGVTIYSTYKDGGYATMSGTSMAAPHMAGLLLLGSIHNDGFVIGDPDAFDDPIAHH